MGQTRRFVTPVSRTPSTTLPSHKPPSRPLRLVLRTELIALVLVAKDHSLPGVEVADELRSTRLVERHRRCAGRHAESEGHGDPRQQCRSPWTVIGRIPHREHAA